MNWKNFDFKKISKPTEIAAVIVVALLLFLCGIWVGLEKARFSYDWNEHYTCNMGVPALSGPVVGPDHLRPRTFNAHGVAGSILTIDNDDSNLTLRNPDNTEIMVMVDGRTAIVNQLQQLHFADLQVGNNVVVIGAPTPSGQIAARLIRVVPNF